MPAHTKGSHASNQPRLKAPQSLAQGPAGVFKHIVNAVDPSHFSAVDLPLLEAYANAAHQATLAAQEIERNGAVIEGKASPWLAVAEKAGKQLVALSARLRICPQSRFDRLVAGANSRPQPSFDGDDDGLLASADEFFGPPR